MYQMQYPTYTMSSDTMDDTVQISRLGSDFVFGGTASPTVRFDDIDVGVNVQLGQSAVVAEDGFAVRVEDQPVAAVFGTDTPDGIVEDALANELYFNIHTQEAPGGEIRGQLLVESDVTRGDTRIITLTADLDSAQEPGGVSDSLATGEGVVRIYIDGAGAVTYSSVLRIDGITSDELLPVAGISAIHIHSAPAGENGAPVLDVVADAGGDAAGNTADGDVFFDRFSRFDGSAERETGFSVDVPETEITGALFTAETPQDIVDLAAADGLYFNIHTGDFGGGEIRGQLIVSSDETTADGTRTIVLDSNLDASQEINGASDSEATGTGQVTIVSSDAGVFYSGTLSVTGLNTDDLLPVAGISAIHIHAGAAGANGAPVLDFVADAGGDVNGLAISAEFDTGDGNVFNEVVEIDLLQGVNNIVGSNDADLLVGSVRGNVFYGLDGADVLNGAGGADALYGGAGDDTVNGGRGADTVKGGEGADVLNGASAADMIYGDVGEDALNGGSGADTLYGDEGADTLDGGRGADMLWGGSEADLLRGASASDMLYGESGDDTLNGGSGADSLYGGDDADLLLGGLGRDLLEGGNGADTLDGGLGNDILTGGADADVFVFATDSGVDTITDFDSAADMFDLSQSGADSFADLEFRQRGEDALVVLDEGSVVVVQGVDVASLTEDLFYFG